MWLSDFMRQENQKAQINKETPKAVKSDAVLNYRVNQQIRSMMPGQTVLGEIVSKNGGQIEIKLADNMIIAARLEADINLDLGKVLSFEVKSNNGSTIALSPLFENLNTSANVVKALDMANIPLSQTAADMVESMMQEGMGIDKTSLQQMYREVLALPDTEPSVLVQMKKLSLPITPENVEQFQNYKSAQHQILNGLTEITDLLPQEYTQLKQTQGMEAAGKFYQEIIFMLTEEEETGTSISNISEEMESPNMVMSPAGDLPETSEESVPVKNPPNVIAEQMEESGNSAFLEDITDEIQNQSSKSVISAFDFSGKEWKELETALLELGVREEAVEEFKAGNLSVKELLSQINEQLQQPDTDTLPKREAVFAKKEFVKLLQMEWKNQLLLSPKEVADKEVVRKLYDKLDGQLTKLQNILENAGSQDSKMTKSVQQLRSNVDFLNQLNQVAAYVQLPLKMISGEAHGDLYVYTSKRNLAKEDRNVSALLHLDMQHLGAVDIYVAMQGQKVNTKFYLEDDEMLDFIYSNIHILNERLEKRGYHMKCELQIREETKNVMEEILSQNKNVTNLTKYSFDVRA